MANLKWEITQAKIKLEQLQQEYHAIVPIKENQSKLNKKLAEIEVVEIELINLQDQYNDND